jgi:F-type H+-transporting ATPase subunit delta
MSLPMRVMAEAWLSRIDKKETASLLIQLESLEQALKNSQVRRIMFSPILVAEAKQQILKKAGFSVAMARLSLWFDKKNLWRHLSKFIWHVRDLLALQTEKHEAKILTAVALSKSEQKTLSRKLSDRFKDEILLKQEVEPEILGGLIIDYAGLRIDASVRGKLARLRESIKVANI